MDMRMSEKPSNEQYRSQAYQRTTSRNSGQELHKNLVHREEASRPELLTSPVSGRRPGVSGPEDSDPVCCVCKDGLHRLGQPYR